MDRDSEDDAVTLDLSELQIEELRSCLEGVIGDMSGEIADTDNPGYRRQLRARREVLQSIHSQLDGPSVGT
jgi:hypothetical protein